VHGFLRLKFAEEILIELFRAPHLDGLGGHHRPRENREKQEKDDNGLPLRGGLFPDVNEFRLIRSGPHDREIVCVH